MSPRAQRALRRKALAKSIDSTYDSLRSHLGDAVAKRKHAKGVPNSPRWEAQCVLDYANTIQTLAQELFELSKVDYKDTVETLKVPL
jgi:hypothetical protein